MTFDAFGMLMLPFIEAEHVGLHTCQPGGPWILGPETETRPEKSGNASRLIGKLRVDPAVILNHNPESGGSSRKSESKTLSLGFTSKTAPKVGLSDVLASMASMSKAVGLQYCELVHPDQLKLIEFDPALEVSSYICVRVPYP